jgi:hypothetical protein
MTTKNKKKGKKKKREPRSLKIAKAVDAFKLLDAKESTVCEHIPMLSSAYHALSLPKFAEENLSPWNDKQGSLQTFSFPFFIF